MAENASEKPRTYVAKNCSPVCMIWTDKLLNGQDLQGIPHLAEWSHDCKYSLGCAATVYGRRLSIVAVLEASASWDKNSEAWT